MREIFTAVLVAATLGGCTVKLPPKILPDHSPVNAEIGIQKVHHHSGTGSYSHRHPVEPNPWKQSNDEQSPAKEES
jgi:hypothetical protein